MKADLVTRLSVAAILAGAISWVLVEVGPDPAELLASQLPLRDRYEPSAVGMAVTYGGPLVAGLMAGLLLRTRQGVAWSALYVAALLGGLAYAAPLLLAVGAYSGDGATALQGLEVLALLPALVMAGALVGSSGRFALETGADGHHAADRRTSMAMALMMAVLAACLAAVQATQHDVPQGADTYAQLASAEAVEAGRSLGDDPHFAGQENSFYPPGAELLTLALAAASGVPLIAVWQVLPFFISPLLVGALLVPLARQGVSATLVAVVGMLLLAWHQVMFIDVAARHLSFAVGAAGLAIVLGEGVWRRALGGSLVAASAFFHFSLAVVAFGTAVALAVALALGRLGRVRRSVAPSRALARPPEVLLLVAMGAPLVAGAFLYSRLASFGPLGIHTVSEVAVGGALPFGFVSLLAAPVLPAAPALLFGRGTAAATRTFAALACVFAIVLAYFTLAWGVYHRYFAELAFLGGLLLLPLLLGVALRDAGNRRLLGVLVALAVLAVLVPRMERIESLSEEVEARVALRTGLHAAIDDLPSNAVILAEPDDISNRYIPALTGHLVYCAAVETGGEFQVVSKPLHMIPAISERNVLARAFFAEPTPQTLAPILADEPVNAIVFDARDKLPEDWGLIGGRQAFRDDRFVLVVLS